MRKGKRYLFCSVVFFGLLAGCGNEAGPKVIAVPKVIRLRFTTDADTCYYVATLCTSVSPEPSGKVAIGEQIQIVASFPALSIHLFTDDTLTSYWMGETPYYLMVSECTKSIKDPTFAEEDIKNVYLYTGGQELAAYSGNLNLAPKIATDRQHTEISFDKFRRIGP